MAPINIKQPNNKASAYLHDLTQHIITYNKISCTYYGRHAHAQSHKLFNGSVKNDSQSCEYHKNLVIQPTNT